MNTSQRMGGLPLKRGLGEFVIIVVGVLVAITIDGWWSDRQDREREAVYLQQLANDLARSEVELAEVSGTLRRLAEAAGRVMKSYWDEDLREQGLESGELLTDLVLPHRSTRYLPITGTARALVNSGNIDLVQSPRVRSAIIEYLGDVDAIVSNIARFDETYYRTAHEHADDEISVTLLAGLRHQRLGTDIPTEFGENLPLIPLPERIETLPFELDPAALFESRGVFNRYEDLLVAHRNQHFRYEELREQGQILLARLAEEGIEPMVTNAAASISYSTLSPAEQGASSQPEEEE